MKKITFDYIKEIIEEKFTNEEFTVGDVLYSVSETFSNSLLGTIRQILVNLSREGYLKYSTGMRGSPHFKSEKKRWGAIYELNI